MVRPSSVAIVTVSYPFLIAFDGSRIDSTRSVSGDALAHRRQVGAEGRRRRSGPLGDVAADAREGRLIEDQRTAAGIADPACLSHQFGRVFAPQPRFQRGDRPRRDGILNAERGRGGQ